MFRIYAGLNGVSLQGYYLENDFLEKDILMFSVSSLPCCLFSNLIEKKHE